MLAKRYKTKADKLESFIQVSSHTESDVPLKDQEIVYTPASDYLTKDSIPCPPERKVLYMKGTFVSAYDSSVVRLGDSAYNRIYSWDTLSLLSKRERIGKIFNRRWVTTVNAIGANPNTVYKINSTFAVADRKPARWVMVAYAGVGYDPGNFSGFRKPGVSFGIGVGRVLFRIK
jgi:hypothetical protein